MEENTKYPDTGTSFNFLGGAQVCLEYGRPGETMQEVADQAHWIDEQFRGLHLRYPDSKFSVLVDLGKLHTINLDDNVRAIYKSIMDRDYIARVGIVGDTFSFTKVLTIMVILKSKPKVKFFFNITQAKDWLEW